MQIQLFDTRPYTGFDFPDYVKVYSVYAYDKIKAHKFWKRKKEEAKKKKDPDIFWTIAPYDVVQKYAIRNADGTRRHTGDEKNIYRLKTLHSIYNQIGEILANGVVVNVNESPQVDIDGIKLSYDYYESAAYEYRTKRNGWRSFNGEEMLYISAELDGTQHLPIYERLKIHIMLLKLLRQGMKIDKAVDEVKERFKEWNI